MEVYVKGIMDTIMRFASKEHLFCSQTHFHYLFWQGLTFWDGKNRETGQPNEIHYDTKSGDMAFIDR